MTNFQFVPPQMAAVPPKRTRRWRWWQLAVVGVVLVVVLVAGYIYVQYEGAVHDPKTASGPLISVTIDSGASVDQIASQLQQAGLAVNSRYFEMYVRWSHVATNLQSGKFQIPQHISIADLVAKLQSAHRDEATLRFIEGWRREEMADYIDTQHAAGLVDMTGAQLSALALDPTPALRAQLGNALAPGDSLQGFLFPDTYVINKDETAEGLLAKMLSTYKRKVSADIIAGFKAQGLTEYEGLTLASIVERESHSGDERAIIAGIFLSRLNAGMPLGVDATLQYTLGYSQSEGKWWRQNLTVNDLAVDSPYNTRKNAGLPPHPICNPSLSAMQAVAHPTDTEYLYYIHDSDGVAHFAKTLDGHNANVVKYLR